MTQNEILAKLLVLEHTVVKLQEEIKDLFQQIREGLDNDSTV